MSTRADAPNRSASPIAGVFALISILAASTVAEPTRARGQAVPPPRPGARSQVPSRPPASGLGDPIRPPAPAGLPAAEDDPFEGPADLTSRYKLHESYTTKPEGMGLGEYQVAFRETIRITDEPTGASEETVENREYLHEGIYTERVAELAPRDAETVVALVRRFDSARGVPDLWTRPDGPKLLSGLTLWYRAEAGRGTQVLVLDGGRRLQDHEYLFATEFTPYLPGFADVLPPMPVQIHASWPLDGSAIAALLGTPAAPGPDAVARLSSLTPATSPGAPAGSMTARIDYEGSARVSGGEARFRADLTFTFTPPAEPAAGAAAPLSPIAPDTSGVVDALGAITQLRVAQVVVSRSPEPGSPNRTTRRDLLIQRRIPEGAPSLTIPDSPPAATPENSWLVTVDPEGRFHVAHPTTYAAIRDVGPDRLILRASRPEGIDQLMLKFLPESADPPSSDELLNRMIATFREHYRPTVAPIAPLPADTRPGAEVRRIEATLAPLASDALSPPLHFNGYVVQYPDGPTLSAEALTPDRTGASEFRAEVESILKTFAPGPPEGGTP